MKNWYYSVLALLIAAFALCAGCAQKTSRIQTTPYTISEAAKEEPKESAAKAPEIKTETLPPEKIAAPDKDKLREEALREEALREKALRDKAREEAERKAAAQREKLLKKAKLESVFFDYDQSLLRDDQKEVMAVNAQWLKINPRVKIRVEGNCDGRGTAEYNLALGHRRAEAAKTFLEGLGVPRERMQTISYGLEKPLDPRHNEAAWAKNRRVDFVPIP